MILASSALCFSIPTLPSLPSGRVQRLTDVPIDKYITVTEA
jgi:hypothetical protein